MDPTARGSYGFNSWTTSVPGGLAVMAETQTGSSGAVAGAALGPLPLHWNNPLFWLLALFLVFTGWVYLGADFGIKRLGSASFKAGK